MLAVVVAVAAAAVAAAAVAAAAVAAAAVAAAAVAAAAVAVATLFEVQLCCPFACGAAGESRPLIAGLVGCSMLEVDLPTVHVVAHGRWRRKWRRRRKKTRWHQQNVVPDVALQRRSLWQSLSPCYCCCCWDNCWGGWSAEVAAGIAAEV